jgi:hypothetical protein
VSELERWRALLGESTRLWAGPEGFRVTESGWIALSGSASVEFNVALCQRASEGGSDIERTLEDVAAARVPAMVMIAGAALGDAQFLIRAGWICVGSVPIMVLQLTPGEPDPDVRRLELDELPAARGLLEEAFAFTPELAAVALPDTAVSTPGQAVWGLFDGGELVACRAYARAQEATVGWSLATPPRLQRRGYATRLGRGALDGEARAGAELALAYCSPAGERAARRYGFVERDRWQVWSRPRWSLARA